MARIPQLRSFDPVAALLKGREAQETFQQSDRNRDIRRLQQQLAEESNQPGFDILFSQTANKLSALGSTPEQSFKRFKELPKNKQGAFFSDLQTAESLFKQGDIPGIQRLFINRKQQLNKLSTPDKPVDTGDVDRGLQLIETGDFGTLGNLITQGVQLGIQQGFIKDPLTQKRKLRTPKQRDFEFFTKGLNKEQVKNARLLSLGLKARPSSASSKVFNIGGVPFIVDSVGNVRRVEIDGKDISTTTVADSKSQIAGAIEGAKGNRQVSTESRKLLQASNIKRISVLSSEVGQRVQSKKTASKFLRAFELGEVKSGAGRKALSFVPGVFTTQAQFDEEFSAFAERAARSLLKANGEIRPTDADVKGMKDALFGIGKDEKTNIQLLSDFVTTINLQDDELNQLSRQRRSRSLDTFIFQKIVTNESIQTDDSDEELKARLGI